MTDNLLPGIIVKALAGFYYAETETGIIECRAAGAMRQEGRLSPLVGDNVMIMQGDNEATVVEILPRRNQFIRPAVANVAAMIIVASKPSPETDPFILDRMIVTAERAQCEPIIVFTKIDIALSPLAAIYIKAGFKVFEVSSAAGTGIEALRDTLKNAGTAAFCGNTGVGKTSILNAMGLSLPTGAVSDKLGRGKHTTRHVELHRLPDGVSIIDTPGFSSFEGELELIPTAELADYFREFAPYIGNCRFIDCHHVQEPGCAVTEAVNAGNIASSRLASYVRLHDLFLGKEKHKYS